MWIDIASIVFICVTANHLGLISAIESATKTELYIIRCPKCFTFWAVLLYTSIVLHDFVAMLAISFLCSYMALWLELLEGYIDTLYSKLYEKIYADITDNTPAADPDGGYSASSMPKL